jgi:hypothetical protein
MPFIPRLKSLGFSGIAYKKNDVFFILHLPSIYEIILAKNEVICYFTSISRLNEVKTIICDGMRIIPEEEKKAIFIDSKFPLSKRGPYAQPQKSSGYSVHVMHLGFLFELCN